MVAKSCYSLETDPDLPDVIIFGQVSAAMHDCFCWIIQDLEGDLAFNIIAQAGQRIPNFIISTDCPWNRQHEGACIRCCGTLPYESLAPCAMKLDSSCRISHADLVKARMHLQTVLWAAGDGSIG